MRLHPFRNLKINIYIFGKGVQRKGGKVTFLRCKLICQNHKIIIRQTSIYTRFNWIFKVHVKDRAAILDDFKAVYQTEDQEEALEALKTDTKQVGKVLSTCHGISDEQ